MNNIPNCDRGTDWLFSDERVSISNGWEKYRKFRKRILSKSITAIPTERITMSGKPDSLTGISKKNETGRVKVWRYLHNFH